MDAITTTMRKSLISPSGFLVPSGSLIWDQKTGDARGAREHLYFDTNHIGTHTHVGRGFLTQL